MAAEKENRYQLMVSGSITANTALSAIGNMPHINTVVSEKPRPSFQLLVTMMKACRDALLPVPLVSLWRDVRPNRPLARFWWPRAAACLSLRFAIEFDLAQWDFAGLHQTDSAGIIVSEHGQQLAG